MVGPGFYERWSQWKSCSPEQKSRAMARVELEKILSSDKEHGPHLTYEEVTTVRRNLATLGLDVDNELIRLILKRRKICYRGLLPRPRQAA